MMTNNVMSDKVCVTGLKVEAVIGVFDWERAITQPLLIDVVMHTDLSLAAKSDDIADAINYKSVCDDITNWCVEAQAQLIERLADIIASGILETYNVDRVEVTVAKPTAISEAQSVAVSIVRVK